MTIITLKNQREYYSQTEQRPVVTLKNVRPSRGIRESCEDSICSFASQGLNNENNNENNNVSKLCSIDDGKYCNEECQRIKQSNQLDSSKLHSLQKICKQECLKQNEPNIMACCASRCGGLGRYAGECMAACKSSMQFN